MDGAAGLRCGVRPPFSDGREEDSWSLALLSRTSDVASIGLLVTCIPAPIPPERNVPAMFPRGGDVFFDQGLRRTMRRS